MCLLLVELLLCMRQVDTALDYISYITSQFASTKNIQVLEKEPAEKKPIVFDAATDAFRLKLLQCQTRCYLMNKCLKGSKKELKTIMTTGGNVSFLIFQIFKIFNIILSWNFLLVSPEFELPYKLKSFNFFVPECSFSIFKG